MFECLFTSSLTTSLLATYSFKKYIMLSLLVCSTCFSIFRNSFFPYFSPSMTNLLYLLGFILSITSSVVSQTWFGFPFHIPYTYPTSHIPLYSLFHCHSEALFLSSFLSRLELLTYLSPPADYDPWGSMSYSSFNV